MSFGGGGITLGLMDLAVGVPHHVASALFIVLTGFAASLAVAYLIRHNGGS